MIRLEKFNRADYTALISWVDSPETLMQVAGYTLQFPLTEEQLDQSLQDPHRYPFKVVDVASGEYIGYAEIYVTPSVARLGRIIIGSKHFRGRGLGHALVGNLVAYCFDTLQQTVIDLNVFDWNISAIKCYQKMGFSMNPAKNSRRELNGVTWTVLNMILHKPTADSS